MLLMVQMVQPCNGGEPNVCEQCGSEMHHHASKALSVHNQERAAGWIHCLFILEYCRDV